MDRRHARIFDQMSDDFSVSVFHRRKQGTRRHVLLTQKRHILWFSGLIRTYSIRRNVYTSILNELVDQPLVM